VYRLFNVAGAQKAEMRQRNLAGQVDAKDRVLGGNRGPRSRTSCSGCNELELGAMTVRLFALDGKKLARAASSSDAEGANVSIRASMSPRSIGIYRAPAVVFDGVSDGIATL
jgi:hypothetical protein